MGNTTKSSNGSQFHLSPLDGIRVRRHSLSLAVSVAPEAIAMFKAIMISGAGLSSHLLDVAVAAIAMSVNGLNDGSGGNYQLQQTF